MKAQDRSARARKSLAWFGMTALLAVGAATAQVATGTTGIDATGSYQSEVQACMSGRTQQDQATCLKEARNAQADKQRGVLDNANGSFQANASARCDVFTASDEKAACQARMMGYGSVEGSVAAGGVLREVETVVLPAGQASVTVEPKTSDPVVVVPNR
jgi:preprotein translocase subunit SecF